MYVALTRHFNSTYDYFKYNGKVKAKVSSFEIRKDKYMFHKLSKHRNPVGLIVSNILEDNCKWSGNLFTEEANSNFLQWENRIQSLTYNFKNEIENMDDKLLKNFVIDGGQHPLTLELYYRKEISIETLIILNDVFDIFPKWNKEIDDVVIWPDTYNVCMKYKSFFDYDIKNMKNILKERFLPYK